MRSHPYRARRRREHNRTGVDGGARVLVLWSFYSPDAAAMADELRVSRSPAGGPGVTAVANAWKVPSKWTRGGWLPNRLASSTCAMTTQ